MQCILFEQFDTTLDVLISERKKLRERFKENELWVIANSLVSAIAYMHSELNVSHYIKDPSRVYVSVDNYKLYPTDSIISSLKERPGKDKTK